MSRVRLHASWAFSFQWVLSIWMSTSISPDAQGVGLGLSRSHPNSAIDLVKPRLPPRLLCRCAFFLAMIPERFVHLSAHPQLVQQHRQLPGHRHHSALLGIAASPLSQLQSPPPQVAIFPKRAQDIVRALYHQRPQVAVSFLADVELRLAVARVPQ